MLSTGSLHTMAHTSVPPVFLVTGFLGSGKTMFLQSLLQHPMAGSANAVIVNDFGETVFDDFLLRSHATTFLELPGGCLCCSALDDFKQALTDVSERSPTRILVETTGLADVASVRDDLRFMGFPVDAVLCTVDALHWRDQQAQFALFEEQIREADYLLVSKADIADACQIEALEHYLRSANHRAQVVRMKKGRVEADILLSMLAPADHVVPRNREQLHLVENPVAAFRIELPQPILRSTFERCMEQLPHTAMRIKGRVVLQDIQGSITTFLLNFVNGRWTLSEIPDHVALVRNTSALALIGLSLAPEDVAMAFAGIAETRIEQGELRFRLPETINVPKL